MKNETETAGISKLRWKYVLLTVSLIAFAVAILDDQPTVISYMARPIGAILFGLFLIATVLDKESALYDEQNRPAHLVQRPVEPEPVKTSPPARPQPPGNIPILSH